jgi:predicted Rossmann-fold nucleotide-binding protein
MKVLVCGGRNYDSAEVSNWLHNFALIDIGERLGRYIRDGDIKAVIHGGASGADKGGARWGEEIGAKVIQFKADWRQWGNRAGPIRNRRMIVEGKPDIVIAFPGGAGTRNMIDQAREACIPVVLAPVNEERVAK